MVNKVVHLRKKKLKILTEFYIQEVKPVLKNKLICVD